MTDILLWSDTDSQLPTPGSAAIPLEDSWVVLQPVITAPRLLAPDLWLWEQGEMPLLTAVDDGGWVPYFTTGNSVVSLGQGWAMDELPTPPSVTPQEDWYAFGFIGLPVVVPPWKQADPNAWINDLVPTQPTTHFDSDASPNPYLFVIRPPISQPMHWTFEQSDWWGGGIIAPGSVDWWNESARKFGLDW